MQRAAHVTIVVPTYNERLNLPELAARVFDQVVCGRERCTLLIIDDNSPDGTAAAALELASHYHVQVHVRTTERGLATAVIEGIRRATGEIIVVMDADLSHPPEAIPALIAALSAPHVQMAIGSRFVPGGKVDLHWPLHRRLISRLGRMLAWPLAPRVRDIASGFFAVRRGTVDVSQLRPIGYKIALELIVRHGWTNIVELPITFADRKAGQTKLSAAEQLRYLRHLCRLYLFRARRLVMPRDR